MHERGSFTNLDTHKPEKKSIVAKMMQNLPSLIAGSIVAGGLGAALGGGLVFIMLMFITRGNAMTGAGSLPRESSIWQLTTIFAVVGAVGGILGWIYLWKESLDTTDN